MDFRTTTMAIDGEALAAAQQILGTRFIEDTINESLRAVARRGALEGAARHVADGSLDLPTDDVLAALRTTRS